MPDLLIEWMQAAAELRELKEREQELRKAVIRQLFPSPVKGLNKRQLDAERELHATFRVNYKVDKAAIMHVDPALRDSVIEWKPSVKESVYNKLDHSAKLQLADAITVTPGLPSLEIKPSK